MERTVDVMLIESRPAAGDLAVSALEAAGHRVHRCHEGSERPFPCRGVTDPSTCPLDRGAEVALLVRHGIHPRPTSHEQGVLCALRAGLPIVEDGADVLDPYEPWIAARTNSDPVGACVDAIERSYDPLRAELRSVTAEVLSAAGADPTDLDWDVERTDDGTHLVATGPAIDDPTRSRLAVRALDVARRSSLRTQRVDISYEAR